MSDEMNLLPFEGMLCPGVVFTSGHCIWFLHWDFTPTDVNSFSQIWIFHPGGERVGYVNSEKAVPLLQKYHSFGSVVVCDMSLELGSERVAVDIEGRDGTKFSLILNLGDQLAQDLISEACTETGYYVKHHAHKIVDVVSADAAFNNRELGSVERGDFDISVGTSSTPPSPLISFCTHYLEP